MIACMQIITLQSGSNGNCYFVKSRGVQLLFDAGITGKQAQQRLAAAGQNIFSTDALIISHNHADHVKYAGIYCRKFSLPVYMTSKTYSTAHAKFNLGCIDHLNHFRSGSVLEFGDITVETIRTPHDAVDSVAFIVDDGRHRLGILTDLGHVFDGLQDQIHSLDAVILESNYDAAMLEKGWYPETLKRRIRGDGGHLSNTESAQLLKSSASQRLQWVCLAHLSEENNSPAVARRAHRSVYGERIPIHVASRQQATKILEVEDRISTTQFPQT